MYTLRFFFQKQMAIDLAYLFGSRARGKEGAGSDYDFGVLFSQPPPFPLLCQIQSKLKRMLDPPGEVDLIDLSAAPIELRYRVIAEGVLIFSRSRETQVEFEARTLSLYFDALPILRQQRREILEPGKNAARIPRYREALRKTQRVLAEIGASKG